MVSAPSTMSPLDNDRGLLGHLLPVTDIVEETAEARTIAFGTDDDQAPHFVFRAGQFLTLAVPSDRTGWVSRCYSISSSPGSGVLAITVKRTREGYASNWLCDNLAVGDIVRVLPPGGLFTPRSPEADLLLCAAGSGVTPVMSILREVLGSITGRVAFFYANRDKESVILAGELRELQQAHGDRLDVRHWLESEEGLPDGAAFADWAQQYRDREIFMCGPAPFMEMVRTAAAGAGFDTYRIHAEEYRSLTGDPFAPMEAIDESKLSDAADAEVTIDGITHRVRWPGTYPLTDVLSSAGIDSPYACREGKCGACMCELQEGAVDLGRTDALEQQDIEDGYILACQAKPAARVLRIEF